MNYLIKDKKISSLLKSTLLISVFFLLGKVSSAQMCSSYTTWTSGMWIGPGSYCGSPYGGTTVTSGGRLYTHRGYCSKTGPGTWDFQDAGGCTSCTPRTVGSASSSPTVCKNSAMTSITHATTQVTGISSSSGLPSGVSASYSSNTITISGTPTASGTFNYTITPTSSCGSATATGTITVTALPTITSSNGASRCGTGTLGIDASASSGSIEWYAASSGGSSLGSSSSGVDWTTPSISSTTTYYAQAVSSGCNSASRTAVTATVNVLPTITSSNGASRCGTGTLGIDASASSGSIEWYAASSGGSSLGSSSSGVDWTTPSISSTTTYYAEADNGTCTSASRTAVTATVNSIPTISGSNNGSRCNTGTVDIDATASAGSIEWYAASSGGSSLGSSSSGASWTTPSISSTTIYYAEADNGGCTSVSRTAVTATVNVASEGPGGVTDELLLWLKADAGTSSIGTSWTDQSCNGFEYTTVSGPTKEAVDWNYNPAIEILSGGFDAPAGAELGTDWTIFFVSKLMASDDNGRLFEAHSGNYLWGYHGGYRNGLYLNGSPASHNSGIATTSGLTDAHIFTYVRENSGGTIDARVDGDALATYSSTNSASGSRIDINQGAYGGSESSDSRVGELIIFNKELSDSEIMKIESYLAVKYGVSLSDADGATGGDYISTSGTTYWDASASTGYNNDILVLGKDDNTDLTQKQVKSKDDSLLVFVNTLAVSNNLNFGSVTNDESFIAIGHNGGNLKSNVTSTSDMPYGIQSRFEREWKLTNTNFDDNFSIEVEWDSSGAFDINDVRLLVDDDGDFSDATTYSTEDGLTFSVGSIIVGGLSTSIFPKGQSKFFTIASAAPSLTLPVELQYFTASEYNGKVLLSWRTLAEVNNDYFIIEKSTDGDNWEEIIVMSGMGHSSSPTDYSAIDLNGCSGICFYRLTQVDFDGAYEVFKAIKYGFETVGNLSITVTPNPMLNEANITFSVPTLGTYDFSVISQTGQLVYEAQVLGTEGLNQFSFSVSNWTKGLYHFVLKDNSGNKVQEKVLKQ